MGGGNVSRSSKEVSAMIKQGFIANPSLVYSSPTRTNLSKCGSPSYSSSSPNNHPSPPPPAIEPMKVRSSPTLFEMMSEEQQRESKQLDDKFRKSHERVWRVLDKAPFQNPPDWAGNADVKLTVSSRDGLIRVSVDVHRRALVLKSVFFEEKLGSDKSMVHTVEICDCDDVEVYLETIGLMYLGDTKEMMESLVGNSVEKVLSLLKVCVAIKFCTGIEACLEYLEAVPWSEEEDEKVYSVLHELHASDQIPVKEVLQRLSSESCNEPQETLLEVMNGVLQAKDEKAQREMKTLFSRLLKEHTAHHNNNIDFFREIKNLCSTCVNSLITCSSQVVNMSFDQRVQGSRMAEIAREADNVLWVVGILIDNMMGDDLVEFWADQKELASLHAMIPPMYRYSISRITAQLCIAIGRRQIYGGKRSSLLKTWLEALFEDYGWMRRCCRSFDQKLVEEGMIQTISTLSFHEQQAILLKWFERYLNKSEDCPNLHRAFETWWRRAYFKQ